MLRAITFVTLFGCALVALAQDIPRTDSGKPFLQGIWQAEGRAWVSLEPQVARHDLDPTLGALEEAQDSIPYLPWAREQQVDNYENRHQLDPFGRCFLPGVPRIMTQPRPFSIWQTEEHIALTFEWNQVFRLIYAAGQEQLYPGFPSWMGDSRGRWQDDVFVVDVTGQNGRTWLDSVGNFASENLQLTEHYRMLDANTIEYRATFQDATVYREDWSIRLMLKRQQHLDRVLEFQCQAEAEEASGALERDELTWYPADAPAGNEPFDESAHRQLPLPPVAPDISRNERGEPDIAGYYETDNGGTNYGFEPASGRMHPDSRGVIIDPADGEMPYQDWAEREQLERDLPHRGYDDPTAHCIVAGLPRSMYVPAPFFILQPPGAVVFLHERMSYRVVYLDPAITLPEDFRLWQGHSVGEWIDGRLHVKSSNFNGKTWLNEIGDVITHAEQLVESFTPLSDTRLIYRATVRDPIAFTRPWTFELPLNRMDQEMLEVACLEDNVDLEVLRQIRDEWRENQDSGD